MDDNPPSEPGPRGHAQLGPLTPAFVSPDDVARYLHERIGHRRDVEYGSVILQRLSDDLYMGSEPMADQSGTFSFRRVLERDGEDGDFVQPEGYRLIASLHSHPDAQEQTRRNNPQLSRQQIQAFVSFYSTGDVIFNHRHGITFRWAYLSGPDGGLLRYQASYSTAERGYVRWLQEGGDWSDPHARDGSVEGIYKKLASVGTLRFVVASSVWGGSSGDVPADWQPYQPFNAPPLPLPCGPVFPDRNLALNYAWSRLQRQPTVRQRVLILQRPAEDFYVPAEPLPVEPTDATLAPLPDGLHLHGLYVHSRPLPGQYPDLEAWLYKHFISPLELAQHIAQFQRYTRAVPSTRDASLYIRMRDEAILRYRFSGSAALLQWLKDAAQSQLHSAALLTRAYVLRVAESGELTVEKTSALWDRPGRVNGSWRPYSAWQLPALSRPFLSLDDAARHAHARIGGRRDQVYAGMILQRDDGRFVITEPAPATRRYTVDGGYPQDRQGTPIILHAGHRLAARYGACTDLAKVEQGALSRQEAELSGQLFSAQDIQDMHQSGLPAYLSTTAYSLIAYQPGGVSPVATLNPIDRVRRLAASGTLRVLIGTQCWGPAGTVDQDWAPFLRVLEFQRPATPGYGALFASADAAALDRYARAPDDEHLRYIDRYFAFILKHQLRDEYLTTDWLPVTYSTPLLALTDALPEGFDCHALCYTRQWAGTDWLERFFITPADLHEAIKQARLHSAALYIGPPEGAVLKYQSASTRSLFEAESEGDSAEVVQAKLESGTLTRLQFVLRLAETAALQVVRDSPCWDRPGPVTTLWTPYAHLQRRRLSPAFLSMDDAARYVRRRVPPGLARHYGGVILRRDDGWFLATEPLVVPDEVFDIKWVFPDEMVSQGLYPIRTTVVACYHSRPDAALPFLLTAEQASVYHNMFSTRVLAQSLGAGQQRLRHYLLAPDGALLSLLANTHLKYPLIVATDLVLRPKNRHDWLRSTLEEHLRSGELTPQAYVNRVAATYTLQVVIGSRLWGEPGVVSGWSPFAKALNLDPGYPRARQDPPCTPICTQPDDAALSVHHQVGTRDELSFGYVLKSTQTERYVATLPVKDAGAKFAHRRVFSDAGYPYRHEMAGLYFCVPQRGDFQPGGRSQSGDGVYQGLFSPADLIEALYRVHATQARGSLPLYISCVDGALLKFVVREPRFIQFSDLQLLRSRVLQPREYIRRMAAAGELRILAPSENWPGVGVVDTQWQPGRSKATGETPLALGPMHAHGEDAARFAQEQVGAYTGPQYLSAVLEDPLGGSYLSVRPLADNGFPSSAAHLFKRTLPKGYRFCAAHVLFHAGLDQPEHPADDMYRRYFVAWRELEFYIHELKRQGLLISGFYLSTRDGALLRYAPRFSAEEYSLLALTGKWSEHTGYTRFAPQPSHFIAELARIGELRVVQAGDFWRVRAVLGADLKTDSPIPAKDEL